MNADQKSGTVRSAKEIVHGAIYTLQKMKKNDERPSVEDAALQGVRSNLARACRLLEWVLTTPEERKAAEREIKKGMKADQCPW